jgi:hypothetical protein
MQKKTQSPWASGPGEILRHGLDLLKEDTDTKRRLAMISIDNAVELMIKTYLGLPQRITGLKIGRKEYQDFSESFPGLLNALEQYAADKLNGIDLGEIEWYHRLRNQLYHQGNGLTVERDKVEVYSELANLLFENLYGFRLVEPEDDRTVLLGEFMLAWSDFEKTIIELASPYYATTSSRPMMPLDASRLLLKKGFISHQELSEIDELRQVRNNVVHARVDYTETLNKGLIKNLQKLTTELGQRTAKCI